LVGPLSSQPASTENYALAEVAYPVSGTTAVEVDVVLADGNVYASTLDTTTNVWSDTWVARPRPSDASQAPGNRAFHSLVLALPASFSTDGGAPLLFGLASVGKETTAVTPNPYLFEIGPSTTIVDRTAPAAGRSVIPGIAGLQPIGQGRFVLAESDLTESALAERGGRMIMGAVAIPRVGPAHATPHRVLVGASDDEGLTWTNTVVPVQLIPQNPHVVIQGDPSVAISPGGVHRFVYHELEIDDCAHAGFKIYNSTIFSGTILPDGGVQVDPTPPSDPWSLAGNGTNNSPYVDHPWLAIDDTGTEHAGWDVSGPGSPGLFYRSRPPGGLWGAPQSAPGATDIGGPFILLANGEPLVAWPAAGKIFLWRPTQPNPGPFTVTTSAVFQGDLYAAWLINEPRSGTEHSAIQLAETIDGVGWSPVQVLGQNGIDELSPRVTVLADGTLLLTYLSFEDAAHADYAKEILAVRSPGGTGNNVVDRIYRRDTQPGYATDISKLPLKCGDNNFPALPGNPLTVFLGDQQVSVGGTTHGHSLRVEGTMATTLNPVDGSPQQSPTTLLSVAALSSVAWK